MHQFFTFIKKETWHILRDVYTLVILLIMPIVLLLILGYAVTSDMKNTPFVVLDESRSTLSEEFIQKLSGNSYFTLAQYAYSPAEIERAFNKGDCKLAIIFSKEFEEEYIRTQNTAMQVLIDASDPNEASTIENYLQFILMQYQQELGAGAEVSMKINNEVKMLYNPQMQSSYSFVPGLMGMLMMVICAMMTSISIVREKELGTMEILLISPLKPFTIILAKTVPYFVVSMIDVMLILLIAVFVMGVPVMGSLATIFLLSMMFTLSALAFGLLISSIANTQQVAIIMALVGLLVPSMTMSGILFPIESMPRLLQIISDVLPAKWYIAGIRGLMIKGVGISAIWQEVTILFGMTVVLLFISIRKFKTRL